MKTIFEAKNLRDTRQSAEVEAMRVHKSVGAVGAQAVPASALYITDRFLEVY